LPIERDDEALQQRMKLSFSYLIFLENGIFHKCSR